MVVVGDCLYVNRRRNVAILVHVTRIFTQIRKLRNQSLVALEVSVVPTGTQCNGVKVGYILILE